MTKLKYTPEIRERAVQLLIESEKDYPSNWAAITAIALWFGVKWILTSTSRETRFGKVLAYRLPRGEHLLMPN